MTCLGQTSLDRYCAGGETVGVEGAGEVRREPSVIMLDSSEARAPLAGRRPSSGRMRPWVGMPAMLMATDVAAVRP